MRQVQIKPVQWRVGHFDHPVPGRRLVGTQCQPQPNRRIGGAEVGGRHVLRHGFKTSLSVRLQNILQCLSGTGVFEKAECPRQHITVVLGNLDPTGLRQPH